MKTWWPKFFVVVEFLLKTGENSQVDEFSVERFQKKNIFQMPIPLNDFFSTWPKNHGISKLVVLEIAEPCYRESNSSIGGSNDS